MLYIVLSQIICLLCTKLHHNVFHYTVLSYSMLYCIVLFQCMLRLCSSTIALAMSRMFKEFSYLCYTTLHSIFCHIMLSNFVVFFSVRHSCRSWRRAIAQHWRQSAGDMVHRPTLAVWMKTNGSTIQASNVIQKKMRYLLTKHDTFKSPETNKRHQHVV